MTLPCHRIPWLLTALESRRLSEGSVRKILEHLVGCEWCRTQLDEGDLRPFLRTKARDTHQDTQGTGRASHPVPPAAYSGVMDRVFSSLTKENQDIEVQRATVPVLLEELAGLSSRQQKLLVRNSGRFQTWAFAEALLDRVRRGWTEDPRHSESFALLAVEVADRLEVQGLRVRLVNDLKAEAWGCVGNCRRIRTDFFQARVAFRKAERFLAEGSGDRLEAARLFDLEASLLIDCGEFEQAERLLAGVIEEYRAANDPHLEGRALMKHAKLLRDSGRVDETIPVLERAAGLIDTAREPWLLFLLRKNLINHLLEAGRAEEAQERMAEVRELARVYATRLERLRLLWTEGLLCSVLNKTEFAEQLLKQVREGFIAAEIGSDVALVSLDLAALYLETGRTEEARELATESIPLFTSRGVHREALAAWSLFREAAERDALTLGLVREVAGRIRNVQSRPGSGDPADGLG